MNDIDLAKLAEQWQRDTTALDVSRRKALRQYHANRLLLITEFLAALGYLWVAWYFWQREGSVFTVSALVLLVTTAISVGVSSWERVPLSHWHDWSPEGVLRYRIRRCESSLRFAGWCHFSSAILIAFTIYLWVNAFVAPGSTPEFFPALYTVVTLITVAGLEWWAFRQRRLRMPELQELKALLRSFDTPPSA